MGSNLFDVSGLALALGLLGVLIAGFGTVALIHISYLYKELRETRKWVKMCEGHIYDMIEMLEKEVD